jgi:hypothetical protein
VKILRLKMKRLIYFVLPLLLSFLTASCEKADLGKSGEDGKEVENGVKVKFCVTKFEQIPFDEKSMPSRVTSDIKDICTRISFAIYKADGDVYDVKNQQADDSGFGTLSISLPEGDYRLIVIAHCGLGVSTFEAEDKVKFKDNKVTDTFYCCQDFTVTKGASYNLELKRAVSKFRLVIDDSIPSNVSKMKFYYTGGSSTFDPESGYGCVNSRQTEYREVTSKMHGKGNQFEVFTFPHEEEDKLKVTVTAQDAAGNAVCEKVFEDVPIKRNVISQYKGRFFSQGGGVNPGGDDGGITFTLIFNGDWTNIDHSY